MKNRLIRERYSALVALSRRVLPSPTAVNKVSALIATRFQRPYDATELSRKAAIEHNPTPEGWEGEGLPPAVAEARQKAVDALLDEDTPVGKISPRLLLTAADLPKVLKRDGGEGNVEGLAEIKVMLGSLYQPDAEELALRLQDDEDGEEPT